MKIKNCHTVDTAPTSNRKGQTRFNSSTFKALVSFRDFVRISVVRVFALLICLCCYCILIIFTSWSFLYELLGTLSTNKLLVPTIYIILLYSYDLFVMTSKKINLSYPV